MIPVPAPRWLGVLALLPLFALLAGHEPSARTALWAWAGAAVLAAGVDVARGRRVRRDITVAVQGEPFFSHRRNGEFVIEILNSGPRTCRATVGIWADASLEFTEPVRTVTLDPARPERAIFPVMPLERGEAKVRRIYFDVETPWRLFRIRWPITLDHICRIFPDIGRLTSVLYSSRILKSMAGPRRANLSGKGREFDQLRHYLPGDPYTDIHWKATARLDRPVTKLYQIERTQTLYAVVDTSRLSRRRHGHKSNLDYVTETVLHLAIRSERENDLFGLIHFSDRVNRFVPAARGTAHLKHLRETVSDLQPEPITPAYDDLMVFIRRTIRRRSFLIYFTDLSDPALGSMFLHDIRILGPKHLSAVVLFRPAWARPLFSGEPVGGLSEIYRSLAGQMGMSQIDRLKRDLKQSGVDLIVTDPEKVTMDAVNAYLRVKERQLI